MARNKKPTVALIYDFDGTLSPSNMQEYGFIQMAGMKPKDFWEKSTKLSTEQNASEILCYMKCMLDEAKHNAMRLTKNAFKKHGENVILFKGVLEWFDLINKYGQEKKVVVEHYINSSGLTEMIEGTPVAKYFKKIYACSFIYDIHGVAEWPGVAVDFTAKTQFLFMINKGIKDIRENKRVNDYMPENERPIPFKNMIYFGDGETDIPCMKLVKQQGGHSIAVYKPRNPKKKAIAEKLVFEQRVNFVCPADYSENKEIHRIVTAIIDKIKSDFEVNRFNERDEEKSGEKTKK